MGDFKKLIIAISIVLASYHSIVHAQDESFFAPTQVAVDHFNSELKSEPDDKRIALDKASLYVHLNSERYFVDEGDYKPVFQRSHILQMATWDSKNKINPKYPLSSEKHFKNFNRRVNFALGAKSNTDKSYLSISFEDYDHIDYLTFLRLILKPNSTALIIHSDELSFMGGRYFSDNPKDITIKLPNEGQTTLSALLASERENTLNDLKKEEARLLALQKKGEPKKTSLFSFDFFTTKEAPHRGNVTVYSEARGREKNRDDIPSVRSIPLVANALNMLFPMLSKKPQGHDSPKIAINEKRKKSIVFVTPTIIDQNGDPIAGSMIASDLSETNKHTPSAVQTIAIDPKIFNIDK